MLAEQGCQGRIKVGGILLGSAEQVVLRLGTIGCVKRAHCLCGGLAMPHKRAQIADNGGVGRRIIADPFLIGVERGNVVGNRLVGHRFRLATLRRRSSRLSTVPGRCSPVSRSRTCRRSAAVRNHTFAHQSIAASRAAIHLSIAIGSRAIRRNTAIRRSAAIRRHCTRRSLPVPRATPAPSERQDHRVPAQSRHHPSPGWTDCKGRLYPPKSC